jgi:hypothetical protein
VLSVKRRALDLKKVGVGMMAVATLISGEAFYTPENLFVVLSFCFGISYNDCIG